MQAKDFTLWRSTRQSPSPAKDLKMLTGAVISSPDSNDSNGDEGKERGRVPEFAEHQNATRSIESTKEGSPDKIGKHIQRTSSEPVSQTASTTALTPEARKISHSRWNTEIAIHLPQPIFWSSPVQETDGSDGNDTPRNKPPLVRKKSGELVPPVLRPSSRRRYSSVPGTPIFIKSVHFNDKNNQTRYFDQVDKPIAVSADSSPVETLESEAEYPFEGDGTATREIKLTNFPQDSFERKLKPVRVECLFLSSDKNILLGTVAVQNIAFQKLVVARFTLDSWKTTSEIAAEYNNDPRSPSSDGCDRFGFHIRLSDFANIDIRSLLLCVRYTVNGLDYWDNNDNLNYHIDFVTATKSFTKPSPNTHLGARALKALSHNRYLPHTSLHARGLSESIDDEFGAYFDISSTHRFGSAGKLLDEPGGSIKLKPKPKTNGACPVGPPQPNDSFFGRYDFDHSLSAALSTLLVPRSGATTR